MKTYMVKRAFIIIIITSGYPRPLARRKRVEKKKNPGINLGQPVTKGRGKKKNPGINPGQVRHLHSEPAGKGRKKEKKKKNTLVLTLGSPPEKGGKKKEKKERTY